MLCFYDSEGSTRSFRVLVLTTLIFGSNSLSSSRRWLYSRGVFNAAAEPGTDRCSCSRGMYLVLLCMLAFTCSIFCKHTDSIVARRIRTVASLQHVTE